MFHAIISWGKKAKADLGKVCLNPNLLYVRTDKPKDILKLHEMEFFTVCIFRNFSLLFAVLIFHREMYTSYFPD